jgi:6-phosphogluconolactonase
MELKKNILHFDSRRDIVIPGNLKETVQFCASQFVEIGIKAIQSNGAYYVALSGGSTPHAIFQALSEPPYQTALDWGKVVCFWSDERSVPPNGPENNYYSGMKAGLENLPLKGGR